MRRFRDVLMDVFNFAKVMIALVVLISIGIVILAIYQVGNAMEDTYHTPAVVVQTAPAPIGAPAPVAAPAAVPLAAPTPTVAVDSKPAPVQEKSPVSIVVKHIGRGSNQFMPDSYVSLVVMFLRLARPGAILLLLARLSRRFAETRNAPIRTSAAAIIAITKVIIFEGSGLFFRSARSGAILIKLANGVKSALHARLVTESFVSDKTGFALSSSVTFLPAVFSRRFQRGARKLSILGALPGATLAGSKAPCGPGSRTSLRHTARHRKAALQRIQPGIGNQTVPVPQYFQGANRVAAISVIEHHAPFLACIARAISCSMLTRCGTAKTGMAITKVLK
jgi:hypothetical protein